MRLLWVITALATVVLAEELSNHDIIKRVLRSWDSNRELRTFEHHQDTNRRSYNSENKDHSHSRSKRSTSLSQRNSYIPPSKSCRTPGYTGEFCESPICPETNENIIEKPEIDGLGASIDGAVLANCTQQYVVLVDETMNFITFQLESEYRVNPRLTLQGEDGTTYKESKIIDKSFYRFDIRFDYLPPGQYVVVPQADSLSSYCMLQMRARTTLTIQGGFVLGEGYQTERSDYPNPKYTFYKQLATVVVHASKNRSPGKLISINFVGEENAIYRPRLLTTRYNCSYEYMFESFYCKQRGEYYFQVEGVTFQGYGFRRILVFQCILDPRPPTSLPPTSPAPTSPTNCQHNGVLINNTDSSTYCYCEGLFGGLNCEKRLCSNGGTLAEDNKCLCPPGYIGDHCQDVLCSDDAEFGFDAGHPTITLVIHTKQQLNNVIAQVVNATEMIVNDLAFDTNYIMKYILVLFNNNKILLSKSYTDFEGMKIDLNKAKESDDNSGGCTDVVFSSIAAALSQYPTNKSPVYIITDALPSDMNEMETVFNLGSYIRATLYFIYVEPPVEMGCSTSIEDPGYRAIDSVVKRTGGMTFYFTNRDFIQDFTFEYMKSTVYFSQLVLSTDEAICYNQRVYQSVSVDSNMYGRLVIVATGRNLSLVISDPELVSVKANTVYFDSQNYIWTIDRPRQGNWLFTLLSSDNTEACNLKVFLKSYDHPSVRSDQYELFWAFTPTIDLDGPLMQPVLGFEQSMVMHLTHYFMNSPSDVHAGLTISANRNGYSKEVYASNGIWRSGCSYNFYFPPFTCQVPNEILYFNFYAQNEKHNTIQRNGVMYCANYYPTPTPHKECQNGGIMSPNNTSCFCTPGFTGTYCEHIVCYNGGTPQGLQCNCVPGWSGEFCEFAKCLQQEPIPPYRQKYVDMIFAVELTYQGSAQLRMLDKQFEELLRDIRSQHHEWIERFILVGFNSTWGGVLAASTFTSDIVTKLHEVANEPITDKGCQVELWRSLEEAVRKLNVRRESFIEIFQTSPPNAKDGTDFLKLYQYTRIQDITINAFISYKNGYFCNATEADFNTLLGLASGSTGTTYPIQPGNTADIVRVIPLQYSSGMVYAQWKTDCTSPMVVFFPIDAYTQTIQLTTKGSGTTVELFDGSGKQFEIFSLLHDSASNLDIWEVRKECDEHWEKVGQYCFYFGIKELNYNSAQDFCHDANAQLVDDLSESKHNLLKENSEDFWLGLKNSGHGYVWDRPLPQEPVALSQSEQYWAGNGSIPVYDTNKQCVFWDSKAGVYPNTWTPDNCYNLRPFICQKHRYDSNNTNPNDIDTGDIPAGKWYAKITTNSSLSSNLGCYIDIRVQSSLQIATAFTTEVSQDAPNYDPVAGSTTNRVTTFVRSQDMGHRSPRLTHAMLWDATNGTLYDAMTYSPRFGCTFPWITQTFKCPRSQQANIEFGISHIGEDEFGNSFQRVTFGHCTKPQISCGNGGIRSNGKCVCTEYWTGAYCTIPICVNGGTLDINRVECICPNGYVGLSCQFAECEPEIRTTFSPNWKTLVLVVETTIHNKPAVDTLVKNINTVIADALQNNPDWFQNYALVTFDTNGVSFSNFQYRNAADLTEALKQAYANITTLGSCDMPIYNAIGFASKSQEIASSNSEILLVTSASNSSTANNERQIAKERLINSQAHLNYFYISNDKCSEEFTDTEVAQLAYVSGGNVLTSNSENLSTLLDAYLPTLYSSSVLRNPTIGTNFKCEDGEIQYVQVDQNTTSIYVTAIAEFGTLGVLNPLRRIIEAATLYRNGKTTIYKIDTDDIAGIYSLSLNSPGPCYIHVYSVGGTKVYTEFALTSKTDPKGSHADGNYTNPFTGTGNIATFHLYGAPGHKGMLQYAEIFDPFTSQLLLRSDLYRRDHCSFEYYSDPFDCKSEFLIIFVYGVDENMQQFRREEATYCRGTYKTSVIPPSTLPTTMVPTTNPMDVKFDVAVLIDVTKEANTTYDNMTNFISELLSIYSVSQSGVRVALIPVTNDGVISVATFDTISSNKNLVGYFKQIKTDYNDFDKMGQALEQALNITIDINFMNAGYRKNINNHVIIYVTSSTTFTDKPQNAVNKILTDGTYGIITVGFVSGISNTSILEHIAGGRNCSFPAETYDLMKSHIQDIRNLISKAEYCGNKQNSFKLR